MNCMKCGREVEDGQTFCPECLEQMEQEPVRITASVHIPRQPVQTNKPHRPIVYLEEEVARLSRSNDRLRMWVILLGVLSVLLALDIYHKEVVMMVSELGKNYSIVETYTDPT